MANEPPADDATKPPSDEQVDSEANADSSHDVPKAGRDETLKESELWWRDRFELIEKHGYRLRPRFRPGWVPSWKTNGKNLDKCEDSINLRRRSIIDATRISDNTIVVLKRISPGSEELAILQMLSTPERRKDAWNHTVPLLDYFVDDDSQQAFVVMPLLRKFNDPPFSTVNEVLDFVRQVLEGINYLHNLSIAHRDCYDMNIMMDPNGLFPKGFHPDWPEKTPDISRKAKALRRSDLKAPMQYYFIDFGISTWFRDDDSAVEGENKPQALLRKERLVKGKHGLLKIVPELSDEFPYDPFPVDMFILGTLLRKSFVVKYSNLHFLATLTNRMSRSEPGERLTAKQALEFFDTMVQKQRQSPLACRWRLKGRQEKRIPGLIADVRAALWEVKYQIGHIPSLLLTPLRRKKSE